jgi:hypothetical protein
MRRVPAATGLAAAAKEVAAPWTVRLAMMLALGEVLAGSLPPPQAARVLSALKASACFSCETKLQLSFILVSVVVVVFGSDHL